jgi:exodeoxyribonuclease V beta subunit
LHELEFYFLEHTGATVNPHVRPEDGFFTGYMDLLFRAQGRYYLVDFKTNLLPGYTPEMLERSMEESDYHRQYRLYLHAVLRWLRRVHGERRNLEKQLGGVYYLYVRGLNGSDGSTGVFFHAPTKQDLDLKRILAR